MSYGPVQRRRPSPPGPSTPAPCHKTVAGQGLLLDTSRRLGHPRAILSRGSSGQGWAIESSDRRACPRPPRSPVPYLPQQPGYHKRLRAAAELLRQVIGVLAADTSWWTDEVWVADSTPVECGRSKETVQRSALAGWAAYGYCPSHSRYFWGLRLQLVCTLQSLPVAFALAASGVRRLRPARKGEAQPAGAHLFRPLRQVIESINQTFKGPAGPGTPRRPHPAGVVVRVRQRILALTAALWHNDHTGQPTARSLLAYDR
jgi:hypothetical protein